MTVSLYNNFGGCEEESGQVSRMVRKQANVPDRTVVLLVRRVVRLAHRLR